jgi:hypothetical protein
MKVRIPNWLTRDIRILPKIRRPPSRWERRIGKGMQAFFTLVLVYFAVWCVYLHFQITRQFTAIRAAGLPASPQELDRWYAAVPDASNAAVILTQAFALFRTFPDKRSKEVMRPKLLDRREKWSAEAGELIAEHVAMNSNALAVAQAALQRPQCRYPVNLSYGLEADLPHLSGLKDLARAAALRAALSAQAGQTEDWPRDVHLMLQLADTLEREPVILSQLVRDAIITMVVQTTERCLNAAPATQASGGLAEAFATAVKTNLLPMGLVGERASAIPVFRMPRAEWGRAGKFAEKSSPPTKPPPLEGRSNPFLWLSGYIERDLNFYLRAMETNIALAALPPSASLIATNLAEQLTDTARRRCYLFSGMILPAISRVIVRDTQTRARICLVQVALAIEQYRTEHGRLPEVLADLAPTFFSAVPTDSFNGEPLRYRPMEKGFFLYSVDRDGQDDGGRQKPLDAKSRDRANYDLTFTVER